MNLTQLMTAQDYVVNNHEQDYDPAHDGSCGESNVSRLPTQRYGSSVV